MATSETIKGCKTFEVSIRDIVPFVLNAEQECSEYEFYMKRKGKYYFRNELYTVSIEPIGIKHNFDSLKYGQVVKSITR